MHVVPGLKVLYFGTPVVLISAHVEESLVIPGTHDVDPTGGDPLIMKFCEFFGGGHNLHPSRLASGWSMPHQLARTPG